MDCYVCVSNRRDQLGHVYVTSNFFDEEAFELVAEEERFVRMVIDDGRYPYIARTSIEDDPLRTFIGAPLLERISSYALST